MRMCLETMYSTLNNLSQGIQLFTTFGILYLASRDFCQIQYHTKLETFTVCRLIRIKVLCIFIIQEGYKSVRLYDFSACYLSYDNMYTQCEYILLKSSKTGHKYVNICTKDFNIS